MIDRTKVWIPHKSSQRVFTHSEEACRGNHCPVHNPSDHHMKDWPQHYREDLNITERICPHGVGHPDPDCMVAKRDGNGIHGCDGCCDSAGIAIAKFSEKVEAIYAKQK